MTALLKIQPLTVFESDSGEVGLQEREFRLPFLGYGAAIVEGVLGREVRPMIGRELSESKSCVRLACASTSLRPPLDLYSASTFCSLFTLAIATASRIDSAAAPDITQEAR